MTEYWYALRTKPRKEQAVYRLLQEQEVEVFFPSVRVKPINPRASRIRPYFPGYLFLHSDLNIVGKSAYSWLPGVQSLVSFGGEPATVPDNLIVELQHQLATLAEQEKQSTTGFQRGDRVRIVSGLFAGYEAIFDMQLPGAVRVQVLLAFLSQYPQAVKLDAQAIVKVK